MWEVGLLTQTMFHPTDCLCTHICALGWPWPAAKLPHNCSPTLPAGQGREQERKSKKTHRSRERHLKSEKTQTKPSDAKAIIAHHFPLADQCPASLWAALALEAKAPLPLFYSNPLLGMTSYGMEYPFGQVGSAVTAMSLPKFLSISSLPTAE